MYYFAPRWPYFVTNYVSLDGAEPVLVNLTSPFMTHPYDGNGSETVASSVLWNATDLSNGVHHVVVTPGTSAVVDAFM